MKDVWQFLWRRRGGHSNQRQVLKGKGEAAQPRGKDKHSVSRSGPENGGSQIHAQGVWFYSGKGRDQAYASERSLCAVCQVAEEDCWEAGEARLGMVRQRRGEGLSQGRKGETRNQIPGGCQMFPQATLEVGRRMPIL